MPIPAPGADISKLEAAAAAGGKAAASKAVARSDSVLVVKNLPFSASEAELEALFGAVGEQRFCGWRGVAVQRTFPGHVQLSLRYAVHLAQPAAAAWCVQLL